MNTLYYLGQPANGFGWGIANTNLVKSLSKLCNLVLDTSAREQFDAPVFVPIIDHSLRPLRKVKAPRILGYAFTEWPIPDGAHREARQYDVLFAGSTWNANRLKNAGCRNVEVLIQGVDHERFFPREHAPKPESFVVFSGGKLEYRKGQDYVIAAMRHFMSVHPNTVLIAAWHNPWPASVASIANSWLLDPSDPFKGLPEGRFVPLPPLPNEKMAEVYARADIGIFPNRCEAGTNLVMCEFMACGKPVIASYAHGHMDVLKPATQDYPPSWMMDQWDNQREKHDLPPIVRTQDGPYLLRTGDYDPAGWFNPPVADIITHLEHAYLHRDQLPDRGRACHELTKGLTWDACARKIVAAAFPQPDHDSQSPALASR